MKKLILILAAFSLLVPAYAQGRGGGQSVKQKVKVGKVFETQNIETRRVVGFVTTVSRVELTTRISADLEKVGFKANELYKKDAASKDAMETTLSSLAACRAELLAAEANLVTAQDDLKHTRIYAPISGRIGATNYTVGNYLTPSSGVLATIIQSQPIRVVFSMSNRDYANMFGGREDNLKKEARIRIRLANGSYFDEDGAVEFINNEANQRTDSIQIYSRFENKARRLIPNNAVTVELSHKVGKLVPAVLPSAVMHDAESAYVYVVKDNKVERRNVELGRSTAEAQLILRGLEKGDLVVTDGTHKVLPGMEIIPEYDKTADKDGVK